MKKLTLISLSVILAASGCTVVPGSGLPTGNKTIVHHENDTENEKVQLDSRVNIYPITLNLLQSIEAHPKINRPNHELERKRAAYRYTLGKGDVLNIRVWYHPDLNTPATIGVPSSNAGALATTVQNQQSNNGIWVNDHGRIFFPLVGEITVTGKTINQVQSELSSRLRKYIKNPQVEVNVAEFRSQRVSISGSVRQAGQLPITNVPMTLLDAIDLAGGITDQADPQNVKWTHNGVDHTISIEDLRANGDATQNHLLSNGDIIYVPSNENSKVFVLGEVTRQSSLRMPPKGITLTEAMSEAGGMDQIHANASGVFVIRNVPSDIEKPIHVYQLNLRDATAYALGNRFKLQTNDVVYITAAPVTRWDRVVSQAVGLANTISSVNSSF
ncbi:polysaccharide export protein [Neisseria canis]|uniref:Capsule polysaccharide export outer membrane protein n=1 Tax=Neisseria canis TaxID=493 RepID=A0A1X3D0J0_9NEIS|nr:polysaccharide export protein [Neisseria canis]OSI13306.1 polysaccharide export protein Wza [Neisseria canis]VEF01693.1 capsule polysaccharide export outer membrane protein [Neisseria canis]